jgi:hypothetical protein
MSRANRALAVCMVWLLLPGITSAVERNHARTNAILSGTVTVSKRLPTGEVQVRLTTASADMCLALEGGIMWGSESGETPPPTLIKSIFVRQSGHKFLVPLSAYADLRDPRIVTIAATAEGFDVTITGGDAGEAYDAVLSFGKRFIVHRRVLSREFPDQAWEETTYSFNTLNN